MTSEANRIWTSQGSPLAHPPIQTLPLQTQNTPPSTYVHTNTNRNTNTDMNVDKYNYMNANTNVNAT